MATILYIEVYIRRIRNTCDYKNFHFIKNQKKVTGIDLYNLYLSINIFLEY